MVSAGDTLEATGVRLHILTLENELLEIEAEYAGEGPLPPPHYHPSQDERFTVLEGRVRTILAGDARTYETGESFVVPAGTVHQMGGEGPARVHWEVRPALRLAEFFERAYSGRESDRGAFLAEFSDVIVFV